jgi:ABC-type branched-subunit amino acid transport system substrate-binding protein
MSEQEAQSAGEAADGIYTSAPYFTSLDTNENNDYISTYESEYGTDTTPNFVAEAAYWAPLMTAELLRQNDPQASTSSQVKAALENEATITAPQGEVTMDPGTHHCSLQSRVGQYNAGNSEFDVVQEFGSFEASGITVEEACLTS